MLAWNWRDHAAAAWCSAIGCLAGDPGEPRGSEDDIMPVRPPFDNFDLQVVLNYTRTTCAFTVCPYGTFTYLIPMMLYIQPFVLAVLSALLTSLPHSIQQASDARVQNLCRRWGHQTCVIDGRLYLDGGRISPGSNFENKINQSSIVDAVLGNGSAGLTHCQIPNLRTKTSSTMPASLGTFQPSTITCQNPISSPPLKVVHFDQTASTRSFTSTEGATPKTIALILLIFGGTTPSQINGHPLKVHQAT